MYKKLKQKLKKLFVRETTIDKYEDILEKFKVKKQKLKDKNDKESQEEIKIINKLIFKVENKIKDSLS